VTVESIELDAADLAEEATLNATDRVELALRGDSLYPIDIAKATGMPPKTVKNALTKLRKSRKVEPTGERNEDGAEQVRLVSHRPSYIRDEDRDTNREDHATSDAGVTL
jgi:DNA-binding CsgD family transcriptional regulator